MPGYGRQVPNLDSYVKSNVSILTPGSVNRQANKQVMCRFNRTTPRALGLGGGSSQRLGPQLERPAFWLFSPSAMSLLRSDASFSLLSAHPKGSLVDRGMGIGAYGLDSAQAGVLALPFVSCGALGDLLLSSPCLSFLICQVGMVTALPGRVRVRTQGAPVRGVARGRASGRALRCVRACDMCRLQLEQRADKESDRPSAGRLHDTGHLLLRLGCV